MNAPGSGPCLDADSTPDPDSRDRLVYSTDPKVMEAAKAADKAAAGRSAAGFEEKQREARLRLDRQGRAGKQVTVVTGIVGHKQLIEALGRELKAACGAGGTLAGGPGGYEIEIQGDQRQKVQGLLEKKGYRVKRVGG